jgi:hypothetical protein
MGLRYGRTRRSHRSGFELLEPRLAMTGVVINEFLALNTSGLQDQDGDRSDWIELRNTSAATVDLAGWHLTDDENDLDKWQLPAINLAPGAYLTIFASGKDRAVAEQELHANFALDQDGEYLALVMPDGATVIDAYAPYPAQLENISYGRGAAATVTDGLLGENAPVRVHVPTWASAIDSTWYTIEFVDSGWMAGTSGVGFDNDGNGVDLNQFVNLNVFAQMDTRNSAYIRMPFQVADPSVLLNLKLRIRYDDGFGVYLNGTPLPTAGRAAPGTLAWNSAATSSRSPQSAATTFTDIDLSAWKNLLVAGSNVLALHGLNVSTSSQDFLIDAQLVADRETPPVLGYMVTPTPGAANLQGTLGIVEDTKFSVDRGFYNNPFTVQITSATVGAEIRYTLDGSPPTATTGLVYNPANPPLITTTTTLRAAAFKTGWTPTNVDTQTYIFLDDVIHQSGAGLPPHASWGWAGPDWAMDSDVVNHLQYSGTIKSDLQAVPTVSLVMPWSHWFGGAGVGIYPTASELERAVSMEFFTADGSEQFQIDGGIEIQGGTSDQRWKMDKLSMRIKFKAPYGPESLDADLFHRVLVDQGAADKFNTLILDAQSNYTWAYGGSSSPVDQRSRAKFIQDQVVADLQNLTGGYAPHGRLTHLYINGLYWGIYMVHERPDEHFAEEYLGGADEDYDVIKHTATTVVSGEATAAANYAAMLNLARQDMSVLANYQAATQKIDIDNLITYMLINYYTGNDDWAHHNWYATYNRVDPNGKWRFHSWDAEHVFKNLNYNAIQTGGYLGSPEEVHLLLMANPEYRLRFADMVQKHMFNGGVLTPSGIAAVYSARVQEADRAMVGESARWGDSHTTTSEPAYYTREHWLTTQNDLLSNYFPFRTNVVLGQFNARSWLASVAAPAFSNYGGQVTPGYDLSITPPPGLTAYYTLDGSDPRAVGGAINGTPYMTPIDISAGMTVKARTFDGVSWSALVEATFRVAAPADATNLRISEIHYNPAPTSGVADPQDLEFIELYNPSAHAVSLDGVQVTEFANPAYVFPNGLTLPAAGRIVIAKNPTVFQSVYGAGINLAPGNYGDGNLSNGGERIVLLGSSGQTIQDFSFDDVAPWPTAADGGGHSIELIDPFADPSNGANWRASYYLGGSPGTEGSPPAGAPGDFDEDQDVDGADFLAWQRGVGTTGGATRAMGDADGDQDVDGADLGLWRSSFGGPSATLAAAGGSTRLASASEIRWLSPGQWIALADPAEAGASEGDLIREAAFAEPLDDEPLQRPDDYASATIGIMSTTLALDAESAAEVALELDLAYELEGLATAIL